MPLEPSLNSSEVGVGIVAAVPALNKYSPPSYFLPQTVSPLPVQQVLAATEDHNSPKVTGPSFSGLLKSYKKVVTDTEQKSDKEKKSDAAVAALILSDQHGESESPKSLVERLVLTSHEILGQIQLWLIKLLATGYTS
jgi:hypothetical protein